MFLTGPYQLTLNQLLTELDPCVPRQSSRVQVQNLSGYLLIAQIGGTQIPIPPFTAATLDEGGGYQLLLNPLSTGNIQSGSVVLLWLQSGESSPVQDGPISTALALTQQMFVSAGPSPFYITGGAPTAVELTVFAYNAFSTQNLILIGLQSSVNYGTISIPGASGIQGYNFPVNGGLDASFEASCGTIVVTAAYETL